MGFLMPRKKTIAVEILFNNWGKDPLRLTREWIEYRLDLFLATAAMSLQRQTSQDFTCFVTCDPASVDLIAELLETRTALPPNIRFVSSAEYRRQERELVEQAEVFYRVFLSSDDMYRLDFIQYIHTCQPAEHVVALVPQYGYLYDSVQYRLGEFFFWLPSYGAMILDPERYLNRQYPHVHGRNTGTTFENALNWRDRQGRGAFSLEPWSNSERSRAVFGPEVTTPAQMQAILDQYF